MSKSVEDLIDFWHFEYDGDLTFAEFMNEQAGWTAEETQQWILTGDGTL